MMKSSKHLWDLKRWENERQDHIYSDSFTHLVHIIHCHRRTHLCYLLGIQTPVELENIVRCMGGYHYPKLHFQTGREVSMKPLMWHIYQLLNRHETENERKKKKFVNYVVDINGNVIPDPQKGE